MDMKKTGAKISTLRKQSGYTQETLAEKLNISPQAISKWETGVGLPEASLIVELSALLKVSVDEILQTDYKKNLIQIFFNSNLAAPSQKLLANIPRISRWNPPQGCDMFYSMPAMITEALCCIEEYEKGKTEIVSMSELNERFCDLMHIMGIGYGFLWEDDRHMVEELWRINDYKIMVDNIMRYYGRDYLWLTNENATPEEMKKAIIWSIDRNHPVVMEFAGGCPEFSIVTGYENDGDTLIGYTYCEECAARTNELGMFVNPARWNEKFDWNVLIIGDKKTPTYTDKDSMQYAIDTLNQANPQHKEYKVLKFTAGDDALRKWLADCETPEKALTTFFGENIFTYALYMNTIYTQKCIQSYFKKLSVTHDRGVNDIIIQIGIAIDRITTQRNSLNGLQNKPNEFLLAARDHIENLLKHREYMRGWLSELYNLL